MPSFNLGGGGLGLALVQGFCVAALFSGFGSLLFLAVVAPPALAHMARLEQRAALRACLTLARLSLFLSVLLEFAWLGLESATMAGASSTQQAMEAVPVVVSDTEFGHLIVAQILLVICALILAWREAGWLRAAACCSGVAVVLQAWHLHAAAMSDRPLLISEAIHVLAGAVWLGSLLPLALLVRAASPDAALLACRRYSPLGAVCILALAITAFWQGWVLVGSRQALIATAYGWMALVKLALFLTLIAFACRNYFQLTPALSGVQSPIARRDLQRNIVGEAAIGLMIVLAASVLASLPPGMDMAMQ